MERKKRNLQKAHGHEKLVLPGSSLPKRGFRNKDVYSHSEKAKKNSRIAIARKCAAFCSLLCYFFLAISSSLHFSILRICLAFSLSHFLTCFFDFCFCFFRFHLLQKDEAVTITSDDTFNFGYVLHNP